MSSTSDTEGSERLPEEFHSDHGESEGQEDKKKGKKRKWNRGRTMTPGKRARQFPGVMEVRGESMWCIACDCEVKFKEKNTAATHCNSEKHKANVQKKKHAVYQPGPNAGLVFSSPAESSNVVHGQAGMSNFVSPPHFFHAGTQAQKQQPTVVPKTQLSLKEQFDGQKENQKVADDFLAAFLQAGIPVNKLTHPSMLGLFKKYTKVAGCIPKQSGLYQSVKRVGEVHLSAIRKQISNKKVFRVCLIIAPSCFFPGLGVQR